MRALFLATFMVLTGIGLASAGEEHESIAIKIVKADDGGETTIDWTGKPGDLDDLAVGESKTLEDGVTVTRTETGLTLEVDGETIDVPVMENHRGAKAFVLKDGDNSEIDVEVIADGPHVAVRAHPMHDGIMIASGDAIDETTQETIRSVLASAGYDQEVRFIDRSMHEKRVMVIKERIEEVHED